MAVRNTCSKCKKRFSAPDELLGKKVECPRCGEKVLLQSPDDVRRQHELDAERDRQLDEDQRRLALIERMEVRRRRATRPYYEAFGVESREVRHFNPRSPSRFLRLRALSEILTFSAYIEALLVLIGIGLTIYLKATGVIGGIPTLLLCLIGWLLIGTILYLVLKLLGELAFVLSELGDQQHDLVQLLLDVRENTETPVRHED